MRDMKSSFYAGLLLWVIVMVFAAQAAGATEFDLLEQQKAFKLEKKARKIHSSILTVDTHVDTPWFMDLSAFLTGEEYDLGRYDHKPGLQGQVDFPRMQEGGLDAAFFVAFISQKERDNAGNQAAIESVLELIELINEKVGAYPDLAEVVSESNDAKRVQKEDRRAIYIGIENGYAIGNDLAMLETYYNLGVRYMGLSHTLNNDICDSSTDFPEHGGLSAFGEQVVAEMNRLGMMVDISHISDMAVWDVLEQTTVPIIASHSNARAVYDHPRNLKDDLLRAIAGNGGVIQVNLFYVSPDSEASTVADVVDHIDHIVAVAGINHVGIGTDFDGGGTVEGCEDVSRLEAITLELVKRGYNKKKIRKIWGGNIMRVFRAVEKAAGR